MDISLSIFLDRLYNSGTSELCQEAGRNVKAGLAGPAGTDAEHVLAG